VGPSFPALVLVTGTSALSTDAYIPSLPKVQASLHASSALTQLTMTSFIAGLAVGQLLSGPVSDARGRRRIVLVACAVFAAMSALCAVATTGWLLVGERAAQGLAAGASVAVGRAMVNDCYRGKRAAAAFGTLSAISLIAPVIGPAIGGLLVTLGDWRTIFWFLAVVGVTMTLAALAGLPETLPPHRRQPGGLGQLTFRTRDLLADRRFAAPVLVHCLTTAGFFVYIGGSSFVLQDSFGMSQHKYTVVFMTGALAMVVSSFLFRGLVTRIGPVLLRRYAIVTQTTAVAALFLACLIAPGHQPPLALVWVLLASLTFGLGTYWPANSTIAQQAGRRFAGTASALGGGLPFLCGSLTTPLTGALGHQTMMTMTSCMAVFFALAGITAVRSRNATAYTDHEGTGGISVEPHTEVPDRRVSTLV
jgi:DHA1 family bicyclomycin/chloramphenicol resistance-like MFS transporter